MGSAFRKAILFINHVNPVHPLRMPLLLCALCASAGDMPFSRGFSHAEAQRAQRRQRRRRKGFDRIYRIPRSLRKAILFLNPVNPAHPVRMPLLLRALCACVRHAFGGAVAGGCAGLLAPSRPIHCIPSCGLGRRQFRKRIANRGQTGYGGLHEKP